MFSPASTSALPVAASSRSGEKGQIASRNLPLWAQSHPCYSVITVRRIDWTAILLTICAVIVTGLVVRRELFVSPSAKHPPSRIPEWSQLVPGSTALDAAAGRDTLLIFLDYQCPYCGRFEADLDSVARMRPSLTRFYRHFPLDQLHMYATAAAVASECAARQGRFASMHRKLFEHQDELGTTPWGQLAIQAEVPDLFRFETCLEAPEIRRRVRQDQELARRLGFRGTPVAIMEGVVIVGSIGIDSLIVLATRFE